MKFTFITLLIVVGLSVGGYVAVTSLKDPTSYISKTPEKIGDLHKIETDPETTIPDPNDVSVVLPTVPTLSEPTSTPSTLDTSSTDLKSNIQKMINSKVTLKVGSKGPNVGYVQTFMNLYFKKSLKVDNDFGPTLEANVKTFQKATGVTQTGQIGPATLGKMIDWLTKNPQ